LFISNANAQGMPLLGGTESFTQMLPLIVMFALLYFMIIRPQMRRSKEQKTMLEGLQKGDEIVAAGLLGKIVKVGDNFILLEIADNVIITAQKQAVSQLLPKGTIKASQ
jgi:preprotein translocase subunit YajC